MRNNELNGIYLVVDPSMEQAELLDKIEQSLEGGVRVLQIWNHWPDGMSDYDKEQLITYIKQMADKYDVPVLINEDWKLLKNTDVDGIHFESIPENFEHIKEEVSRDFFTGITCSNDLEVVKWAEDHDFDYVSFCAMFPSPSVESCPIVQPETVRKAREITDIPLFLSGGITPENIGKFDGLDFNGVAVISGILKDEEPQK
ncbi:MAG: thiamine phosphate synthase, partial [Aliifodinibius sp.]|nr:thiamine phosphate synthase [Fodinibius sp.]NIW41866.1 thiamine phosphate synthase [candidate division Zixibacteria bacterium]NIX55315.1 thiamine phosphate synthase [candidate division Zixibacteria bacterium]NIY23945.1 thiamine phosphate synthase [Fodinibius sp.]